VIKINSVNTIKNRQSRASCIVIKLKKDQFGSNTIKNRQSRASCIVIKLKKDQFGSNTIKNQNNYQRNSFQIS
jgi:hypothetical protein